MATMFKRASVVSTSRLSGERYRSGFTLIELLVVIAIIALLIGVLLPAIGKARLAGYKTKSLANVRSTCTAAFAYQNDYKGFMPIVAPTRGANHRKWAFESTDANLNVGGYATWSFAGGNCSSYWASYSGGGGGWAGIYDFEAADRPLNRYITDANIPAPNAGVPYSSNAEDRYKDLFPSLHDPSDRVDHQQDWPNPMRNADPVVSKVLSCYESTGTSYQFNVKWHEQLWAGVVTFNRAWWAGVKRLRAADGFASSRFAWMHDEWADITIYNQSAVGVKNGYGDINKSVMGFMDGHGAYLEVYQSVGTTDPAVRRRSYINDKYTFVFEDLPI